MFLILLSEIVFFANFACDKSRWFSPSLPPKKKMFAGGKLSCLKRIVKFLRVLLKTNQNNCTFLRLLLAINRNNFWQKSIKATFASGKSRWLKKSKYIFANFVGDKFRWLQLSRLVLAINRDDCSFLRLLVVINQDECIFLLTINRDNCSFFSNTLIRIATPGLWRYPIENQRKWLLVLIHINAFKWKNIEPYPSIDNCWIIFLL